MTQPTMLLCGGTGALGSAIARHLSATGTRFRALVRPTTDPAELERLGAVIVRGDLRDPASLAQATAGITTVISGANAIGRLLGGAHDLSIHDVDDVGYQNLITAAEAAGVRRFVYVSALEDQRAVRTPFTDAKAATEARLAQSTLEAVIVRPDMFREVWLGPTGGFDVGHGKVTIYGRGRAHHRFVATDDVAQAIVALALAPHPPTEVELAGPDAVSAEEAVRAFEQALGRPLKTTHVPRLAMQIGRRLMRPFKPELASIMGMALASDLADTKVRIDGFAVLGISAQPVLPYVAEVAAAVA